MKNRLWLIALVAVIGFSFAALSLTGCSDGGGTTPPPNDGIPTGDSNPFIGTWIGIGGTLTITDSTLSWKAPGKEEVSSTYTRNGNTATFQIDGNVGTAVVSGNTMPITVTVDGNEIKITFAKVDPIPIITSIADFATWLAALPTNTVATAYSVKLNVSDLGGGSNTVGSVGTALRGNYKYVSLDLSGSTFTTLPYAENYGAFESCASLISVTIPASVTSIGDWAFNNCTSLTSVTISDSVTSIGNYAFSDCRSLTSVTIGSGVTSIGHSAFASCTSLTVINVDASNSAYIFDNGVLYNKDKTTLIQYPAGKTDTTFTIPGSVTSIGGGAFRGCSNLTGVTIGSGVTSIGQQAFSGCIRLASVTIPDSVTSIGYYAFEGCTSLTAINVDASNSAYSSDNGVLYNKAKTTLILYPAKKTDTTFIIPDSVTSIGDWAFYYCTSLTSVTIQDSVTSIGSGAFSGCWSLTSVTISDGVTSIGYDAFYGCTNLTSITIPNSVTSIGSWAFGGCTSLTSVTFATGSNIQDADFGGYAFPEGNYGSGGNTLKTAYSTGKAGTYTRAANGSTWTRTP